MFPSLTEVSSRTARAGSIHINLAVKPLAYFKRLRSETEIQRSVIKKMTLTDEPYVFLQFQV